MYFVKYIEFPDMRNEWQGRGQISFVFLLCKEIQIDNSTNFYSAKLDEI